jgi:hypothetical protein
VISISEETRKFSNRKNELVSPIRNCQGKMTYKMQPLWKQMLGAKKDKAWNNSKPWWASGSYIRSKEGSSNFFLGTSMNTRQTKTSNYIVLEHCHTCTTEEGSLNSCSRGITKRSPVKAVRRFCPNQHNHQRWNSEIRRKVNSTTALWYICFHVNWSWWQTHLDRPRQALNTGTSCNLYSLTRVTKCCNYGCLHLLATN